MISASTHRPGGGGTTPIPGPNRYWIRYWESLLLFATESRFATVITKALPQQPPGSYWESLLLFATGRQWESSLLELDLIIIMMMSVARTAAAPGRAAQTH